MTTSPPESSSARLDPHPRHIIFDVDGTLTDSMGLIVSLWEAALQHVGLASPGSEAIRQQVGRSLSVSIPDMFPAAGPEQHAAFTARYKEIYSSYVAREQPPLYAGVRKTLEELLDAGFLMTLATGKSRVGLTKTLRAHDLDRFFVGSRTADDAPSKPHPAMVEELLAETGTSPQETILIGDTTFDLDMARAAGVRALAVTYGGHSREQLAPSLPTAWLDTLPSLLPLLLP